jgi:hypothetical protein
MKQVSLNGHRILANDGKFPTIKVVAVALTASLGRAL